MILYHVTTCKTLPKILKEGLKAKEIIDFGTKEKANIWFTDKTGIDAVARYWVKHDICVIQCDIPKSYIRVGEIVYYGSDSYAIEYYIRVPFKLKWIVNVEKYT